MKSNDHDNLPEFHYNRANRLCLGILLICIIIFAVAYYKGCHDVQVFAFGGISTCSLVLVALNPINEKENDYEEYRN